MKSLIRKEPNPILHGLAASGYILMLVAVMNAATKAAVKDNNPNFLAMALVISLFTLSTAVMAYLFGYQPAHLYFSGKKEEAVRFFLKTTVVFASTTIIIFLLFISGISRG